MNEHCRLSEEKGRRLQGNWKKMTYGKEWLSIVNGALADIGSEMLSALDEGTTEANYANIVLPQAVEEVYSVLEFYDIAVTEELPRLSGTHPLYEYTYKRPENTAKILKTWTVPENEPWELSEGSVCTNATQVFLKYVKLPETPEDMPPYARNLVRAKLAARLATPLSKDTSLASTLENIYQTLLSNAISLSVADQYQKDRGDVFWTDMGED